MGFNVDTTIKDEQVVLKGRRDFRTVLLVVTILFGVIIGLVYYWTRPFRKIIINIDPDNSGGSVISITTYEKKDSTKTIAKIKGLVM